MKFANWDSIIDSFRFDVLTADTREKVKGSDGQAVSPVYDFVQNVSGLGFKQTLDVVEGDTIDYLVNQKVQKNEVSFEVVFKGADAYEKLYRFNAFFGRYADHDRYITRFSYIPSDKLNVQDDSGLDQETIDKRNESDKSNYFRRYIDFVMTAGEPSQRSGQVVMEKITLRPLSPWYEEVFSTFSRSGEKNTGKIYPYGYPYRYGGGAYDSGNYINNDYLKDIPLKITLQGPTSDSPYVSLHSVSDDGQATEEYAKVRFPNQGALTAGQTIVIDAFTNRVYMVTKKTMSNGNIREIMTDMYYATSKAHESFLFAKQGKTKVSSNINGGTVTVESVRYVF